MFQLPRFFFFLKQDEIFFIATQFIIQCDITNRVTIKKYILILKKGFQKAKDVNSVYIKSY